MHMFPMTSCARIDSARQVVRTFFRTNRSTCLEWLARVRLAVIVIAEQAGQTSLVVRQAWELMRDMKHSNATQTNEFEKVLVYLVRALVKLRCWEAIQGLYAWCKDTLNRKLQWMKSAVEMAAGRCV